MFVMPYSKMWLLRILLHMPKYFHLTKNASKIRKICIPHIERKHNVDSIIDKLLKTSDYHQVDIHRVGREYGHVLRGRLSQK